MLHDSADNHLFAVTHCIHVHLNGVGQEEVEEHRRVLRDLYGGLHVMTQLVFFVDNLHGPSAEHVRRTHNQWVANFFGQLHGLVSTAGSRILRL